MVEFIYKVERRMEGGYTPRYLIPSVKTATAVAAVMIELGVIAWNRNKFMDTPIASAVFQVVLGGWLEFAAGILIGSS